MPWLSDYETFHKKNRGALNARYLVHKVNSSMSGGLGDRLRGMLYTVRAAAAGNRVVLFEWSHPVSLDFFFEPGSINWRPDGLTLPKGPVFAAIDRPWHELRSGLLFSMKEDVITVHTNQYIDSPCPGCPPVTLWGSDATCLWSRMFKPLPGLELRATKQLQVLYKSSTPPPYTAIHMRLGGLTGESEIPFVRGGGSPFDNFLAAATCANRLRVHYSMDLPILVITDNHKLREMLQVSAG